MGVAAEVILPLHSKDPRLETSQQLWANKKPWHQTKQNKHCFNDKRWTWRTTISNRSRRKSYDGERPKNKRRRCWRLLLQYYYSIKKGLPRLEELWDCLEKTGFNCTLKMKTVGENKPKSALQHVLYRQTANLPPELTSTVHTKRGTTSPL